MSYRKDKERRQEQLLSMRKYRKQCWRMVLSTMAWLNKQQQYNLVDLKMDRNHQKVRSTWRYHIDLKVLVSHYLFSFFSFILILWTTFFTLKAEESPLRKFTHFLSPTSSCTHKKLKDLDAQNPCLILWDTYRITAEMQWTSLQVGLQMTPQTFLPLSQKSSLKLKWR